MAKESSSLDLSQHLQDCIVRLAITSDSFLVVVRSQLDPDFLSSETSRRCLRLCYDFFDRYHTAPKNHFHDELIASLAGSSDEERELFALYEKKLAELHEPSFHYVLSRVDQLVRYRRLTGAAVEFARKLDEGDFSTAEHLMLEALRSGLPNQSTGVDYWDVEGRIERRSHFDPPLTGTGFQSMDKMIGGLQRGQLVCILGGYKGKKTWVGMTFLKEALRRGLSCLHVSHEMRVEEIEDRYDMIFGALVSSHKPAEVEVVRRIEETEEGPVAIWTTVTRPSIYDRNAIRRVTRSLRRTQAGGGLVIKKFPGYSCTVLDLEALLDRLEKQEGFIPDVVLNDYPDIMKPLNSKQDYRHQINETYLHLKRIADERDLVMIVPSQANRKAIRAAVPSIAHFAEDIRKAGHVDMAFAICQTKAQLRRRIGVFYCLLNRAGPMDVACYFWYNLRIGQIPLATYPVHFSAAQESEQYGKE